MLRSREEARGVEAAVRGVTDGLGLPFVTGAADVRARSRKRRESVEEAARHLRFEFLGRQARRLKARVVVIGHTIDDRAETVLLHLLRGSGLDGLAGLRPRSAWPFGRGPALARPLLEVTRAETLRYCREAGVAPREDPTNLLLDAARNRVRHELLPALRRFNPRLEEALSRLGEATADAVDYLDAAADAEWRSLASLEDEGVAFPRRAFGSVAPALRARLLRRAVRHLAGPSAELEAVHIAAVEEALAKRRSSVSLRHGLTAWVGARDVRIATAGRKPARTMTESPLVVPGRTDLPGWIVMAEIVSPPPLEPRPRTRFEAWLDADALGPTVVVRSRRPGDRLRPLGLGGQKKLQDLFVDAKVSQEERDAVPVVCAPWGIAWVVGLRVDERAALREGSRSALRLRFRRARRNR
jgi:tRNA(Ile)-lysidine synthase